jgi:hypothetical protein
MKRKLTAVALIAMCLMACTSKVNVDPTSTLNDLRARAERLRAYADGGIAGIDALLAEPTIAESANIANALRNTRPVAVAFRDSVVPLVTLVASIKTLNPADKETLRAQLAAVQAAFNALSVPLSNLAELIAPLISKNANIARIQADVRLALVGVSIAITIISSRLQ